MLIKLKPRTLAIAVVGILAGSGIAVLGSGMFQVQPENSSADNASDHRQGQMQANSPAKLAGVTPAALRGIGIPMPAKSAARQAAEARAQTLLRQEKIRIATAAGKTPDEESLSAERYTPRDVVVEADGSEHVRMDRTYQGLPVIGGGLVVHSRDDKLLSSTHTLDLQVPEKASSAPDPALSKDQAILAANKHFEGELLRDPAIRTVYYAKGNRPTLAYEVDLFGTKNGMPVNQQIYVDANSGTYLDQDAKIFTLAAATGSAFTLNRGKVSIATGSVTAAESPEGKAGFLLVDPNRGGGKTLDGGNKATDAWALTIANIGYKLTGQIQNIDDSKLGKPYFDTDNLWGNNEVDVSQRIGAEVHYGVAKTWDYYKQEHGRSGIANDGKGVRAIANVQSNSTSIIGGKAEYTNAFWFFPANTMFYLNGSEAENSNPVIALDVAAHEMTHGVTSATNKLLYNAADQGGLNEASSDIMGTLVEFFDNSPKDPPDYLIGENVYKNGIPGRYMFKPSLHSASVDCYPKGGFEGINNHNSSGVANHFFYLLSEGTVVPMSHRKALVKADLVCNDHTALTGIGNTVAGRIWYRAFTLYMVEQTNYPQAREATQKAAADLVDRGLLSSKQANAVACAWEAVDVPLPEGSTLATCQRT